MSALHKARLLAMAFGVATVVMLGGCKTTSYDTTLDTWIGVHSDNLIVSRGPPDRTYSLSDGRQVFAYFDESTALRPDRAGRLVGGRPTTLLEEIIGIGP